MKTLLTYVKILSCLAFLILFSGISYTAPMESMEGIWYGVLNVDEWTELQIAITLSYNQDDTISGIFNVIGQGEIPFDEITVNNDTIILKMIDGPFEIEGTIDYENESVNAELQQGDTKLLLILKRVEVIPD